MVRDGDHRFSDPTPSEKASYGRFPVTIGLTTSYIVTGIATYILIINIYIHIYIYIDIYIYTYIYRYSYIVVFFGVLSFDTLQFLPGGGATSKGPQLCLRPPRAHSAGSDPRGPVGGATGGTPRGEAGLVAGAEERGVG
jgi:hypothetical protein